MTEMKRSLSEYFFLGTFIVIFLWAMNARYPAIGDDFFYVFPRLLEGKWHFLRQGFAPLRFAVHLCGGFPQYGNPQDHFYSLAQILSLFFGFWTATLSSAVIMITLGYMGWVRFGQDILSLSRLWAHTLALVCLTNGFYLLHMVVGHLWIVSLPLLSWLLWLVFLPDHESNLSLFRRSAAFGCITAYILYSGSQTLLLLMALIIITALPFDIITAMHPLQRLQTILRRVFAFGVITLLLCASKLVAVMSLLQTLNVHATFSEYHAGQSVLLFALKSFWMVPQSAELFVSDSSFVRIHEESMLTPHIALLGLLSVLILWIGKRRSVSRKMLFSLVYATVLTVIILLLVRGSGALPTLAQNLPLFSALRVPERFLYMLSLLISIGGVSAAAVSSRMLFPQISERVLTSVIGVVTLLLFLASYSSLLIDGPLNIRMPYDQVMQAELDAGDFLSLPVSNAFQPNGERVSDFYYLFSGSTGTDCYEATSTNLPPLQNGPVTMEIDGAFNMYNPSCLQYPAANHCLPGDRIALEDRDNLERLVQGEKTTWKLSILQIIADDVTMVTLVLLLSLFFIRWQRNVKRNPPGKESTIVL